MWYIESVNSTRTEDVVRRLARIEGQVRGVKRLVEEGAYCCDVLNQLNAVRAAVDAASAALAANHIRHCIVGHDSGEGHAKAQTMTKEELLDELQEVLGKLVR